MDSLMAAELLVTLQTRYEIEIPPMELLRNANGTLADISKLVYLRLGLSGSTPPPGALPSPREADASAPTTSAAAAEEAAANRT
ncbi:acyl carrier protein (plasmid) [Streptomyces sp. CA-294286]|uniref:acyl carrier protein n=1 Tax=Streptomyces sp. CA-294286 TaxID=3240070 RepID=UPI003D91775E